MLLESLHASGHSLFSSSICTKLAAIENFETLVFMRSLNPPSPVSLETFRMAKLGKSRALSWLIEEQCSWTEGLSEGQMSAFQWLNTQQPSWIVDSQLIRDLLQLATDTANQDLLVWLIDRPALMDSDLGRYSLRGAINHVAREGPLWLLQNMAHAGMISADHTWNFFDRPTCWANIKWLVETGRLPTAQITPDFATRAAGAGQMDLVQWSLQLNPPVRPGSCATTLAASNGHLTMLPNSLSLPCHMGACYYEGPMLRSDLAMLDWLWEQGVALFVLDLSYWLAGVYPPVFMWILTSR